MASKSNDFDKLLLNSIDEALLTLGEPARKKIYLHIEKNYHITRETLPQELEHFQTALEKIFGVGSRLLEILIMQNLYAKIDRPLSLAKDEQLEFIMYVNAARKGFIEDCHDGNNC